MYGLRWTSSQPETPSDGWCITLRGLTPAEIGLGLDRLAQAALAWPPSAPEFRALCRPHREHARMYTEARLQLTHQLDAAARERGRSFVAAAKAMVRP